MGHKTGVVSKSKTKQEKGIKAVLPVADHDDDDDPKVTPRLPVTIDHKKGSFTFQSFPDTGSAATLLASNLAEKHKIPTAKTRNTNRFVSVNGDHITTQGRAAISIATAHHRIATSTVITPAFKDDIIIGLKDLRRLWVVSKGFPAHSVRTERSFQKLIDDLVSKFSHILTDELPDRSMHGDLMRIHLNEGTARPFRVLTTRNILLHWEIRAKAVIDKLIKEKVIVPVSCPTEWCAPGFFVLKEDGHSLRLVNRLVHWFKQSC